MDPAEVACSGILLHVADVDRSVKFYTETLGLKKLMQHANEIAIVDAGGGFSIYLHRDELGPRSERLGVGVIVHFSSASVDACEKKLLACNYPISMSPTNQSFGRRQMYLYDPDGYNIVVEQFV